MDEAFDPRAFVRLMCQGAFDGRLHQELSHLTREQLEEVAVLLVEQDKRAVA